MDQCLDHCLLLEQNPKIEMISPRTSAPMRPTEDNGEIDDLNFHVSKRKHKDPLAAKNHRNHDTFSSSTSTSTASFLLNPFESKLN